ncbi:DNA phosphorothioation-dependent restriction protein DptG [Paenibacillus sp.]|uniref:DNA phosphorothioation-dependent restriction protein DptG n=1 Tax=Paenibacillus sp. TaxID=58172 RepID=UPI002D3E8A55|nr:DNA phosphorothioation-dependent restriction protein DptG [Paenibacillus sp.]HZG86236.1 DNA phosphorothioation-dependent restriction protein DptG [Paenibacillus sp.]
MTIMLKQEQLEKSYRNNHPQSTPVNPVLPFVTKQVNEFQGGIDVLIGEYVRQICGHAIKSPEKHKDELEFEDPLILQLTSQIDFKNEAQLDLERFLRYFLFGNDRSMNVFHPYIYNYLPEPDKESLRKYAAFISDVLVEGDSNIAEIFKDKQADDLLTELILNNLQVVSVNRREKSKHQGLLPFLSAMYREDLLFLSKYKDYFLSHFPLLTHFYAFMYICQLAFKFERFLHADYSQATPFYFALEWETLSKRRKATEELGYRAIKDKLPNLFVHVHTMTMLSMHSDTEGQPFLTYVDIDQRLASDDNRIEFVNSINRWLRTYRKTFLKDGENQQFPDYNELGEAMKGLFQTVQQGVNQEAAMKYGKNLPAFGGKTLIKSRSSLGQVFNMTQEMLLLLTAVCVKETRMPLNALFTEFTKRGVDFDRLSKKAIIELFDTLNILDKKSDSGDAQYVKPIL